jgi:hypothetical protein
MIYIEKHWETIDDLRDISRIIREYYNRELADELDELIDEQEAYIDDLKNEIINLDNLLEFEWEKQKTQSS